MKILHTADWHLGHQLHGHDRRFEHDAFLDWLADTIKTRDIDALLVAGDLFDTANPPASAWQQLYRFLARLRAEHPALEMVLIGGNHDSPSKLDAPHELLRAFDLHLVGSISRDDEGASRPSACWCRCEAGRRGGRLVRRRAVSAQQRSAPRRAQRGAGQTHRRGTPGL
jgi:exonuclease SbcD